MSNDKLIDDVKTMLREAGFADIAVQTDDDAAIVSGRNELETALFRWSAGAAATAPPRTTGGGPSHPRTHVKVGVAPTHPGFDALLVADPEAVRHLTDLAEHNRGQ